MIKSTDQFVTIGSSHSDCQDFAISEKIDNNIAYAILTDGCSASHQMCKALDFGARLMAYSARKTFKNGFLDRIKNEPVLTNEVINDFGKTVIQNASKIRTELDIHPYALDTTLLMVVSIQNKHHFFMYGDGCIFYKPKNGDLQGKCIEFQSGAPFYLNYFDTSTDSPKKTRLDSYCEFSADAVVKTDYSFSKECSKNELVLNRDFKNSFYNQTCFTIEGEMEFVSISSDGLKSFQKPHQEYPEIICSLELKDVVPSIFGYKNYQGQFVERRMKNFLKDCGKINMTHYDDVSVASISFGEKL